MFLLGIALAGAAEEPRITHQELVDHITELASDRYEGRAPGTEGGRLAVAYVAAAFEAAGVEPGFPDYRQPVPLRMARTEEATLTLTSGGLKRSLALGEVAISGGTSRTLKAPVVFGGHGVVGPGRDDYGAIDVSGKVVLLLPGAPGLAPGLVPPVQASPQWKKEEAARRGAAGVLWIHQDSAGYPWEAVAAQVRQEKAVLEEDVPPVSMMIPYETGQLFLGGAGEDLGRLTREASEAGFQARPIDLKLAMKRTLSQRNLDSHNVVGVVRGTARPDEVVLYTAHWDHVGVGEPTNGDPIRNGAVDNATGTAALIEIAEAFAADPPERTVVLVATTAEELGLLGARHYATHPLFPLDQTLAVLNMDAFFPFGETAAVTVVGAGTTDLEHWFDPVARAQGRQLQPDPTPEAMAYTRSDHYPLAERGVPAIFAVGGPGPEPSEALIAQYMDFMSNRYHQPADEVHEGWDFGGILQDARLFHAAGRALADDTRVPRWQPGAPFGR